MGTTSVCATFVHATSNRATVFHTTFVQGQNFVVYKCNHSCLNQTIKFQTSYRAKPKLGQLKLMLSLAQLSPSLSVSLSALGILTFSMFFTLFVSSIKVSVSFTYHFISSSPNETSLFFTTSIELLIIFSPL